MDLGIGHRHTDNLHPVTMLPSRHRNQPISKLHGCSYRFCRGRCISTDRHSHLNRHRRDWHIHTVTLPVNAFPDLGGFCSFTFSATTTGAATITAHYDGDSAHATSSTTFQITIANLHPTTITV